MINNRWLAGGLLALACQRAAPAPAPAGFQGVVELEETTLSFELGGRLRELLVDEGDVVEAGAVLARIDPGLEQSSRNASASQAEVAKQQVSAVKAGARGEEVRSLTARLSAAKANEDLLVKQAARERQLLASGAVAAASADDVEARLARATAERQAMEHDLKLLRQGARSEDVAVANARARAAVAALEQNDARLERHELHAPMRAVVLDVHRELGEVVGPGAPVITLADTHQPYVDVMVPQAKISAVSVGQSARIKVDALSAELPGRVEHIARRTEFTPRYLFSERERATLVVRVRVRIDDAREQLRAGVPAFIKLAGMP